MTNSCDTVCCVGPTKPSYSNDILLCTYYSYYIYYLVGGIPTPLKNISQLEGLSHIYIYILWKIKNVPSHQPDSVGKTMPS